MLAPDGSRVELQAAGWEHFSGISAGISSGISSQIRSGTAKGRKKRSH
jgi:hypothetical protein